MYKHKCVEKAESYACVVCLMKLLRHKSYNSKPPLTWIA